MSGGLTFEAQIPFPSRIRKAHMVRSVGQMHQKRDLRPDEWGLNQLINRGLSQNQSSAQWPTKFYEVIDNSLSTDDNYANYS